MQIRLPPPHPNPHDSKTNPGIISPCLLTQEYLVAIVAAIIRFVACMRTISARVKIIVEYVIFACRGG